MFKKLFFTALISLVTIATFLLVTASQFELLDSPKNETLPEPKIQARAPAPGPASLYKPALDYEQAVIAAIERTEPAVVSIVITKDLPIIENCPYGPFGDVPPEFQDIFGNPFLFEFGRPCQTGTETREVGGGSGFIVSADGLIVTNKHVVLDEDAEYTVLTNNGEKHRAKILARDPVQDIAVIKINAVNLQYANLGDSDTVKIGQTSIAIGNALGEFRNTVSVGVISGLSRNIVATGNGFLEKIEGLLQTDAAINQGNSGGPLLNLKGEVIGVNTAVASDAQNIGFAIPVNRVKRDIESVQKTGSIQVPFLGIRYMTLAPDIIEEQNLSIKYGALIRGGEDGPAIVPGSPADEAGLQAEDIVLEINNEKITKDNSLGLIIQKYKVGDMVNLKIRREESDININVTLGERPDL